MSRGNLYFSFLILMGLKAAKEKDMRGGGERAYQDEFNKVY